IFIVKKWLKIAVSISLSNAFCFWFSVNLGSSGSSLEKSFLSDDITLFIISSLASSSSPARFFFNFSTSFGSNPASLIDNLVKYGFMSWVILFKSFSLKILVQFLSIFVVFAFIHKLFSLSRLVYLYLNLAMFFSVMGI